MDNGTGTDRRRLVREFVEYLELISREWGSSKPTARIGTNEVCAFIQQATADCHASLFFPKISDDAMLEAYRADKARWFARRGCTGAESVHAGRTDGDAAEAVAQGLLVELRGAFALEFTQFALDCFKPDFGDGDLLLRFRFIGENGRYLAAAKKRANALDWLAARIEELEERKDGTDFHDVIIAYRERLHNCGSVWRRLWRHLLRGLSPR